MTNYEMNECAMRGELFGLRPHDKAACERAIMAEMMRRMDPAEFWLCMRGVRATVMMPKIIAELA